MKLAAIAFIALGFFLSVAFGVLLGAGELTRRIEKVSQKVCEPQLARSVQQG